MIILPANTLSTGGYEVANSCRFNDGDNPKLIKTQTAGDQRQGTFSAWIKKTSEIYLYLMSWNTTTSGTAYGDWIRFNDGCLDVIRYTGSVVYRVQTNRLFRDTSAWYHICVAYDSDQATASNRIKIYVNGVQETSLKNSDYPAENLDFNFNDNSIVACVGRNYDTQASFDGYMAEVCWIDGLQLTASSFGEFDEDSPTIWKPIDVSGLTFGTNGFYLDFEDSGDLDDDESGESNDLTLSNLAAVDQSLDTPTVNYPVMNPLDALWPTTGTSWAFSEGNLQVVAGTGSNSSTGYSYNNATFALSAGKFYWEVKPTNVGGSSHIGIISEGQVYNKNLYEITNSDAYTWNIRNSSGSIHNNNSISSYASSYTTNDIIGVALDLDNNKLYFSKNGAWGDGSGSWDSSTFNASTGAITITAPASNGSGHYFPVVGGSDYAHSSTFQLNFGSAPYTISSGNADGNGYGNFEYTVPSGFLAINSYNLGTAGG